MKMRAALLGAVAVLGLAPAAFAERGADGVEIGEERNHGRKLAPANDASRMGPRGWSDRLTPGRGPDQGVRLGIFATGFP